MTDPHDDPKTTAAMCDAIDGDILPLILGIDHGTDMGTVIAVMAAAEFAMPTLSFLDMEPRLRSDVLFGDSPSARLSEMGDRLQILDMLFAPDDRPVDRMGFRHPHPPKLEGRSKVVSAMFNGLQGKVTFIDTPKPIGKRKARRLRGKGKQS